MQLEFYKLRIEAIRDASSRGRWVFAAATVASLAQLGAAFNAYFSWIRGFPLHYSVFSEHDKIVAELQQALLRLWVESQFVSVPLLGIRFSITDASVVGSIALTVLAVWLFYSLRRENHLIGIGLREAKDESQEIRAFVYHGICGTQVFSTMTRNDLPFTSLDSNPANFRTVLGVRRMLRALVFLPAAAIFFVVICDVGTILWIPAAFREQHVTLLEVLDRDRAAWASVTLRTGFALALGISTMLLLWRATQYQDGTMSILREVGDGGWGFTPPGPASTSSPDPTVTSRVSTPPT